ncbi:MAG: MFS transporter [Caulobacteraceae bacterium]
MRWPGWLAPALLCLLRFGQGFGLGGEWGGAALLAVENAPPGQRARYGMFPQLGAPVGFIAANGLFLLLGPSADARRVQGLGLAPALYRLQPACRGGLVGAPEADRDSCLHPGPCRKPNRPRRRCWKC